MALPKAPVISFAHLPDQDLIDAFINAPLTTAKALIREPEQKLRFWQLLEKNANNPKLTSAYQKVQQVLGVIPTPQPQAVPATPTAPPITTAAKIVQPTTPPAKAAPKNPIGPQNAKPIEEKLNELKNHVYDYFAQESTAVHRAAAYSHSFTENLLGSLALYRGELAKFYLDEGAWEMIFSALGPLGDAMRYGYGKDIQRKMSWMKNPLNPNAIYYYLNSLPTRKAFEVMYLPVKATFGILARGGAPLISRVTYTNQQTHTVQQDFVFTPLLRATQFSQKVADGLDKLSGTTTDTFRPSRYEKSPWEKYIDKKNYDFGNTLTAFKDTKKQFLSTRIVGDQVTKRKARAELIRTRRNLKNLLNQHDGGFFKAFFRSGLNNTARRLRQTNRNPISFLFALIGGALWDITAGLILNTAKVLVTKIINAIPGLNTLRAQAIEFFSSNRYMTTARIGGTSIQSFVKGTFSITTASSTYAGASIGGWIANALGLPAYPFQVIGGGIGATFGSIYTTSLKMANTQIPGWVQEYQGLKLAADSTTLARPFAEQGLKEGFIKSGGWAYGPGPLTRLANFLNQKWWVRLPINGFVFRSILLNYLPSEILSIKVLGIPLGGIANWLPAIDYFWQIKGGLAKLLTQPSWNIFGKTLVTPYYRFFSLNNPSSFLSNVVQKVRFQWLKFAYGEPAGFLYIEKPWLQFVNKYIVNPISKVFNFARPFLQNFINPGLFMGFSLVPLLTPALGGWAYLAGPVLGSAGWLISTRIAAAIVPKAFMSPAAFMSRFNALGWTGFIIGQLTGMIFFGWNVPFWYTAAWTVGFPTLVMGMEFAASIFGLSLTQFLAGAISGITQGLISTAAAAAGIAQGLAVWATVTSIAAVAGLAIFTGFVIYSSFWVPLVEESQATPQSTNFSINSVCNKLPNNNYQCCSSFDITQPLFNRDNYLAHFFDLSASSLVVQLFDQETNEVTAEQTTDAFRRLPQQQQLGLDYLDYPKPLGTNNYTISTSITTGVQFYSKIDSFLSLPYDQQVDIFTHINQNPQLATILQPFVELLQKAAPDVLEDKNPKYYFKELEAQLKLFKAQKEYLDKLIDNIKTAAEPTNIDVIISELNKAKNINAANPLDNPENAIACAADNSRCLKFKANMQNYYNSWNNFLTRYSVDSYLNQAIAIKNLPETDPNRAEQLTSLRESLAILHSQLTKTIEMLDQQIKLANQIKDMVDKIYNNLSKEDANFVLGLNAYNLTGLSSEDVGRLEKILRAIFGDQFSGNYFYIPRGTNYKVCLEAEFRGQPGQPQTVCSTISASQSFWGQSNFAKHCTTFTP